MEIVTQRFLLRDFVESVGVASLKENRSPFLNYQSDPRNLRFHESAAFSPEHAAKLFDLFQTWAMEIPRLNYQLVIVQRQEPYTLIGCCGLRGIEGKTGEMELGIELAPTYWGRYRYAIEVGRALLDFGFNELKLEAISGSTVSANTRIARLAEWSGAEVVVIRPGAAWMTDLGWSEVEWLLTKERWQHRVATVRI